MKRMMLVGLILAFTVALNGCASRTLYNGIPPGIYEKANSRTYNADINRVWAAAIASIGADFYVIDNISKESGIITLTFSVDEPADYIDCGIAEYSNDGQVQRIQKAKKRSTFLFGTGGAAPQMAKGSAQLEGKANIIFIENEKGKTTVTVNVKYIVTFTGSYSQWIQVGLNGFYQPVNWRGIVSFNTGQRGFAEDGLTECVTMYTLEKKVLDRIAENLATKQK